MSGNRMSFGQFVDTVQEQIKSYLPEKYQEAEVRTTEFQKLNDTYVGMTVRQEEQMIAPNINLNAQYEQYIRTGDMDRIFHTIAEQVQLQPEIQTDWLRDYEKVKDRLFIRVSDAQANKDYLANLPHKTVDGLAVTYSCSATDSPVTSEKSPHGLRKRIMLGSPQAATMDGRRFHTG